MKIIKLNENLVKVLTNLNAIQSQIVDLSKVKYNEELLFWENLKKKYPKYNFDNARVENKSFELILPFEER